MCCPCAKERRWTFCVDYSKFNDVTSKAAYPLPRTDDALDSLISALDLASGYWQVEVEPKDRHKATFTTLRGLFEFSVLSFW